MARKEQEKIWKEVLAQRRVTGHFAADGRIHKGHPILCSRCRNPHEAVTTEMSEDEIDLYNLTFEERNAAYDQGRNPYAWWNKE